MNGALLIAVMLTGTALLTRAALPSMRRRNYGRIVNIGSVHALIASPFKSAYVAAKHGLIGFSKTVALETHDADITIKHHRPMPGARRRLDRTVGAEDR